MEILPLSVCGLRGSDYCLFCLYIHILSSLCICCGVLERPLSSGLTSVLERPLYGSCIPGVLLSILAPIYSTNYKAKLNVFHGEDNQTVSLFLVCCKMLATRWCCWCTSHKPSPESQSKLQVLQNYHKPPVLLGYLR